jgi:uncharacterized membrane protein
MRSNHVWQYATAVSIALALGTAHAADDARTPSTNASTANSTTSTPMTGKEKATAIGATSGAVAGAVVGGPVGAVVGAGIGAYVGNQGTDANGKVATTRAPDGTVRNAQMALNDKGYDVGRVDGQFGPATQSAVRRFQSEKGLAQSGRLDSATLAALGVNG